jgi:hypothetical protein
MKSVNYFVFIAALVNVSCDMNAKFCFDHSVFCPSIKDSDPPFDIFKLFFPGIGPCVIVLLLFCIRSIP